MFDAIFHGRQRRLTRDVQRAPQYRERACVLLHSLHQLDLLDLPHTHKAHPRSSWNCKLAGCAAAAPLRPLT